MKSTLAIIALAALCCGCNHLQATHEVIAPDGNVVTRTRIVRDVNSMSKTTGDFRFAVSTNLTEITASNYTSESYDTWAGILEKAADLIKAIAEAARSARPTP